MSAGVTYKIESMTFKGNPIIAPKRFGICNRQQGQIIWFESLEGPPALVNDDGPVSVVLRRKDGNFDKYEWARLRIRQIIFRQDQFELGRFWTICEEVK